MNESTAIDDKELEEKTDKVLNQLNKDSDSKVKLEIGVKDGQVLLNFGKAISRLGLSAKQAEEIGKKMRKLAKKIIKRAEDR